MADKTEESEIQQLQRDAGWLRNGAERMKSQRNLAREELQHIANDADTARGRETVFELRNWLTAIGARAGRSTALNEGD